MIVTAQTMLAALLIHVTLQAAALLFETKNWAYIGVVKCLEFIKKF